MQSGRDLKCVRLGDGRKASNFDTGGEGCVVWLRREERGGPKASVLCGCGSGRVIGVSESEPGKESEWRGRRLCGCALCGRGCVGVWLCGLLGVLGAVGQFGLAGLLGSGEGRVAVRCVAFWWCRCVAVWISRVIGVTKAIRVIRVIGVASGERASNESE